MLRRCHIAVILFCLLLFSSCVVPPLPLTHRTEAPNGTMLPDLDFIQPGVTTRGQVEQNLPSLDTGATPGMFWGRFNHSVMSSAAGNRSWGRENLVISYDDRGLVRTSRRVGDQDMNLILRDWLVSRPKMAFRPEVRIAATRISSPYNRWNPVSTELTLRDDDFSLVDSGKGAKFNLHVPPARIKRIQAASADICCDDKARANTEIVERIWLDSAETGKHPLIVQLTPANLLVVLDYLRQYSPNVKYE